MTYYMLISSAVPHIFLGLPAHAQAVCTRPSPLFVGPENEASNYYVTKTEWTLSLEILMTNGMCAKLHTQAYIQGDGLTIDLGKGRHLISHYYKPPPVATRVGSWMQLKDTGAGTYVWILW